MKILPCILTVLLWTVFAGLTACTNHTGHKITTDKSSADSSSAANHQINPAAADSLTLQKEELTKIYTRAIAEFIKAAYKKDKTTYDTLFFGKRAFGQPDDFPDIELPQTIEKTPVRLISPEVGQRKQAERKSLVYVNLIGWVDNQQAEFFFVVFSNGAEHQYDYVIHFITNASTGRFDLDKIEFENYTHLNGKKPERITVYSDGKYTGDK